MEKILITGGSGLLGGNLAMMAREKFEVYATYYRHPIKIKKCITLSLDIRNQRETFRAITKIRPELIIHTAALTDVDYCEEHPEEAWSLNVGGTMNLAMAAENIGAKFVYISTDSVFDGKKGMYTEEDYPSPLNHYAKTKLEGENILGKFDLNYSIVRTCIYGWNMQKKFSLAEWVINELHNKKKLAMFTDVFFSPILVNNLSEAIFEIYERDISGLLNVAGSERCSKFHFGKKIAEVFFLDGSYIEPISIDDYKGFKAPRPKDVSLDVSKAKRKLRTKLLNVEEGLVWMRELLQKDFVKELKECMEESA
jgi:dTDP-4-dehydrorhamnose reductase